MTNRTKYILFTQIDDPEIQPLLDSKQEGKEKVLVLIDGVPFELVQHESSAGKSITAVSITGKTVVFSRFLNRDCPTLEDFMTAARAAAVKQKQNWAARLADMVFAEGIAP